MNITLLMNRDIASNFALNLLLPGLRGHDLTVFVTDRLGKGGFVPPALRQLQFIEQGLFNQLLFPLLGQVSTGGRLLTFDALGEEIGRPVAALNRINTPESLSRLRESHPDLIVSMRYGGFLKAQALSIPRFGVLNLHAGLLPQHQGLMATFRAMLDGSKEYGCTLHYIVDDSVDTGPIVEQRKLALRSDRSYLWHLLNLYPDACEMVCKAVEQVARTGSAPSTPQSGPAHYYTVPDQEEIERFHARGLTLFDGDELLEFTRAYLET